MRDFQIMIEKLELLYLPFMSEDTKFSSTGDQAIFNLKIDSVNEQIFKKYVTSRVSVAILNIIGRGPTWDVSEPDSLVWQIAFPRAWHVQRVLAPTACLRVGQGSSDWRHFLNDTTAQEYRSKADDQYLSELRLWLDEWHVFLDTSLADLDCCARYRPDLHEDHPQIPLSRRANDWGLAPSSPGLRE